MKTLSTIRTSTLLLRLAVSVIGLAVLAICLLLLPVIWTDAYREYPHFGSTVRVIVIAMYLAAIPFYVGIYHGWQILNLIDSNQAFSDRSVRALFAISICAAIISGLYLLSLPFFYQWAQYDDAPGLIVINLFLIGMPMIISVGIGILKQLLAEAVAIKSENELTV